MQKRLVIGALLLLFTGCKTIQYVPIEHRVEVAVHDTTVLHKTDTLVKVPEVSLRDFVNLEDTLTMSTDLVTAKAWLEESSSTLKGTLVQRGKLPVQIVERERIVYRDSIDRQEVPVEVKVPQPYTPWYSKALASVGVIAILLFLGWIVLKIWGPKV